MTCITDDCIRKARQDYARCEACLRSLYWRLFGGAR